MHPRTSTAPRTTPRPASARGAAPHSSPAGRAASRPVGQQRRPAAARPQRAARVDPFGAELEAMFAASATRADEDGPTGGWLALGLPQRLVTALERSDIRAPFAIQSRVLPDALAGRDILGRAQTGSGKTLGFGLPMLTRLAGDHEGPRSNRSRRARTPRGLVLVPTRELAGQVADALAPLGHALDIRLAVVVGGAPMGRQIAALERGTDIVVATPGRLLDLIERGMCTLEQVEITVLDEADYMADLGFLPAVTQLLDMTPAGGQRMLFSATLDDGVRKLVSRFLVDPAAHAVATATATVEHMDHKAFVVRHDEKQAILETITKRPGRTLLFVRTRHGADRLATHLKRAGVEADAIHGNLAQNARQRALDAFTSGRRRVLVATDVAARGIHVDDLDLVIHVDPPADHKDYMHRSGRTARAGNAGTVLSLLTPDQVNPAARQRDRAGVTAVVSRVGADSPEVAELAASGETIVVAEEPRPAPRAAGPRGERSGAGYRGQGGRRGQADYAGRTGSRGPRREATGRPGAAPRQAAPTA